MHLVHRKYAESIEENELTIRVWDLCNRQNSSSERRVLSVNSSSHAESLRILLQLVPPFAQTSTYFQAIMSECLPYMTAIFQ